MIKYAQMGLAGKILQSPEPWLCYYCGDGSDQCPGSGPGRGHDGHEEIPDVKIRLAGFFPQVLHIPLLRDHRGGYSCPARRPGPLEISHAQPNMEHAWLNSVWPAEKVEIADLVMAFILSALLLSNTYRCFSFIMGDLKFKVPLGIYIKQGKELLLNSLPRRDSGSAATGNSGLYI